LKIFSQNFIDFRQARPLIIKFLSQYGKLANVKYSLLRELHELGEHMMFLQSKLFRIKKYPHITVENPYTLERKFQNAKMEWDLNFEIAMIQAKVDANVRTDILTLVSMYQKGKEKGGDELSML
jgi:hypothetical protein